MHWPLTCISCSPRWEMREAGGDVSHPRLGMKGGVGDILPTLPQNLRRPQNPPPPPALHRTRPKTTPRKQPPPPPPRGRRPSPGRRKVSQLTNEAPPEGVSLERRWRARRRRLWDQRSLFSAAEVFEYEERLSVVDLIWLFLSVHFILKQAKQSVGSELESVRLAAHNVYNIYKKKTHKNKCIPCILPFYSLRCQNSFNTFCWSQIL